jgi:alpha-D-ribose 1-methylphosphonate 5-triphosphate synthase subunit PhnH
MKQAAGLRETGFDHTFGSQASFRLLLEATARPGTVVPLGEQPLTVPPASLRPACALLLGLLDLEVSVSVLGSEGADIADYLCFNTGVQVTSVERADFVFVVGPDSAGEISRVKRGSLPAPHEGATVIYAPEALGIAAGTPGATLCLAGPGIPGQRRLGVRGIARAEWSRLEDVMDFPLGVDIWLAAQDGHLAVIPRSVRWKMEA